MPDLRVSCCSCGHVREGLAQELCEEACKCGKVCCGKVEKMIAESFFED